MEATTIPYSRRVSSSASFLQFFRAAHKRPTDPAVQVGALDAEPRLVDLGPPPPVRCARCASTRNLELLLPTGRWINLPMEQRLFCERKASRLIRCTPKGKEATTATHDATAMAEETIWRTRVYIDKKTGLFLQHSSFVWPKHQHHARPEVQKWCRWLLQSHDSERRNVTSAAGSLATQPQPQL